MSLLPRTDAKGAADVAHLLETPLASEELLKGNFLHIRRDTVSLPDGS